MTDSQSKIHNLKLQISKYLPYLLLFGIFLTVAGVVSGSISEKWGTPSISLVVTGSVVLIIGLGFWLATSQDFWGKRATQAGTNALIATTAMIVILGLVNFLGTRYTFRLDLTETKLFTLSPQSQELVKNLDKPLKVWVFVSEPNPNDKDLLVNYRNNNPNFEFEFVDPQVNLGLAEKFKVTKVGEVYLEYGADKLLVQDINNETGETISESQLTNAIARIQRTEPNYIYFLQGHGELALDNAEGSISDAVNSLEGKGYQVEPVNIGETGKIAEKTDVLVIAGAKRQLLKGEVEIIEKYVNKGGSILVMLDPQTDPGLKPFLKEWGIELDERLVIDGSGKGEILGFGPATPIITHYGNHPITKDFGNGISLYPLSRAIGTVEVKNVQPSALLITDDQTWAETNLDSEKLEFNENQDIKGPLDLGVAFTRKASTETSQPKSSDNSVSSSQSQSSSSSNSDNSASSSQSQSSSSLSSDNSASSSQSQVSSSTDTKTKANLENEVKTESSSSVSSPNLLKDSKLELKSEDQEQKEVKANSESRLVIFGSSTFATNGWFNQQSLNSDVFLNSVDWLAKNNENSLSIRPREQKNRRIKPSPLQAALISWLALFIIPLAGIAAAVITWWRRR